MCVFFTQAWGIEGPFYFTHQEGYNTISMGFTGQDYEIQKISTYVKFQGYG